MNSLISDNPQKHEQIMLNLAYVGEDECLHIREMELDFTQYIKEQCRKRGCDLSRVGEYEMCDALAECISDSPQCPVFLLYMVAVQAATLRERLKKYEDTGLAPEEITALSNPTQKYQTRDGVEVECDNCGTMIPLMEPKPGLVFIRQFCPFCGELLK